jgi:hypothetical protein
VTVAVRPPEYFPRLAYAALLAHADRFVVADTLPYSRQSHQNRCRIRTAQPATGGSAWLTVPLVGGAAGTALPDVRIAPAPRWRQIHRKTLLHHYGSAPFWPHFAPEIEALLVLETDRLADLTAATVAWTAAALGAPAAPIRASELPGAPDSLPTILEAVGASVLLTLPESAERDTRLATRAGAASRVLHFAERPRRQNFPGFAPGCAALDLLLNYGPEARLALEACVEPRPGQPRE